MPGTVNGSRPPKGYKVAWADHGAWVHGPVSRDMLLPPGDVSLARFARPGLAPRLAVTLATDLRPGATPGTVHLALGGLFPAVEITDGDTTTGAFLLAERLVTVATHGGAQLRLGGTPVAAWSPPGLGEVGERLAWLAGEVGGLRHGQTVLLEAPPGEPPRPAAPGPLILWDTTGILLSADLTA